MRQSRSPCNLPLSRWYRPEGPPAQRLRARLMASRVCMAAALAASRQSSDCSAYRIARDELIIMPVPSAVRPACTVASMRSEEHTSELQSLMRISYAVSCLQKKNRKTTNYLPQHNLKTNNPIRRHKLINLISTYISQAAYNSHSLLHALRTP